ncbi:MAG: acyl-CoA dehydrogenase family protein [Albidovulum sp.]|nr:acyl-CoA dehydrogenase family protein [Albidovulum sp.]
MNLGKTERLVELHNRVVRMIVEEIKPLDSEFLAEVEKDDRWALTRRQQEILSGLKSKARRAGLWNLWLSDGRDGNGLTTVEYAYLAEEMGKSHLAPEVFNCNAPDTGNMELLRRFGSEAQKKAWLRPLLDGEIRSAFLMTEPNAASSDATNISMSCVSEANGYRLNGEKWWATGAGDPRCAIYIVMVRTSNGESRHQNHSMVLVPAGTDGIEIVRPMEVYGHDDAPHGHMHIRFRNVFVPKDNLVAGEGLGFKIAQGRLGPGRIHHCMRAIGQAEYALELLCRRSIARKAFGKPLASLGENFDIIANCRSDIEMARLLCLKTAWLMDQGDDRVAAPWISKIKVVAPEVALRVTDQAVQMHGAAGISQDTPLARQWAHLRTLRLADGPDAVHRRQVARAELKKYSQEKF